MSIFYGGEVSVSANTATKLVDSAEVDRQVTFLPGSGALYWGFTSGEVTGRTGGYAATLPGLVLPAGKELWGFSASAVLVQLLVTAIAR